MTSGTAAHRAHFTDPPVKSVLLTVFFEPVAGLQVSHLSGFREGLRDEFPTSAEMPPLQPRNRGREEAKFIPVGRSWPFPYVAYSSADDSGSIAIQNDRLVRAWSFSAGENTYPGFDALYDSLNVNFDRLAAVVQSETGQELRPTASEAWYRNTLPEMTDTALLTGIATRWSNESQSDETLDSKYAGIRLHLCDEDELEGCSINLSVDRDMDGADLDIEVSYDLPESTQDNASDDRGLGGLRHAHNHVIATFLKFTGSEMRQGWGQQT